MTTYTVSLFLPFARLLLRTARPPFVAIRTRKPWVRFIFVLLKFVNVFFIVWTPVKIIKLVYRPQQDLFVKVNMAGDRPSLLAAGKEIVSRSTGMNGPRIRRRETASA